MACNKKKQCAAFDTKGRRLFLVDIENLVNSPVVSESDAAAARDWAYKTLGIGGNDLVIVGTSHEVNCLAAMSAWQGVRHVLKRGHDGADLALIHSLGQCRIDAFDEVVFLSGDGGFTEAVEDVAARGVVASVVTRGSQLSSRLSRSDALVQLCVPDEFAVAA